MISSRNWVRWIFRRLWQHWIAGCVVMIIAVAFVLRIYAIEWGLPYVDHPDEPSAANTVLGMLRRDDWNPHFFKKPSLYYYSLRLAFEAHWLYGLATGLYDNITQLPRGTYYYMTAPGFFVWGRALTAVFGAVTTAVLFWVGRRWWGVSVGLIAAALLAVLPFHVRHSQLLTVDVLTGLTTLLAFGAALRLLDDVRWRNYALAGLAVGLATATKYNAVIVASAVVLAHGITWRRASLGQFGRLAWAGGWSLVGFSIGTPYVLLATDVFFNDLFTQYSFYADNTIGDLIGRWPVMSYLSFFWNVGLQPPLFIVALVGGIVAVRRRDRAALVLLGFMLPYLLFFLALPTHFLRNLIPLLPLLLLLCALGIVSVASWSARQIACIIRFQPTGPEHQVWPFRGSVFVLTTGLMIMPFTTSVQQTRFYEQPHSKVCAGDAVRARVPSGMPVMVELNAVEWADQPFVLPVLNGDIDERDAAWYRAQGYRYLAVNVRRANSERYTQLRDEAQVLAVCPGAAGGQPGSRMELLDLGSHPSALDIEQREAVFADRLRFLGFQRGVDTLRSAFRPLDGERTVSPGQVLLLNFYWQPLAELHTDYAIFLHLLDSQGQVVAQRDTLIRATDYPTSHWQVGELVLDMADLPIPADLAAGKYHLVMGVYDIDTQQRLSLPTATNDALSLMQVRVE